MAAGLAHRVPGGGGHNGHDREADRIRVLAVDQAHRQRRQEHQAEHADDEADDVND